jgi:phosphatidate cytidylyltransferase
MSEFENPLERDNAPEIKKEKKKKEVPVVASEQQSPFTALNGLSNLQQRVIAGVLGGAFVIGSVYLSEWSFFALFFGITLLSMMEFYKLIIQDKKKPNRVPGLIIGMLIYTLVFLIQKDLLPSKSFLLIPPFLCLLFIHELYINKKKPFNNVAFTIIGLLYVAIPFSLLTVAAFSKGNYSYQIVLGSLFLLWASDSGAYFSGKTFGKTKLFERVSPKKTWEGSIGGAALSMTVAVILAQYYTDLLLWKWCVLSAIIVIVGSYGDLVESSFKRSLKLKDSGSLIPGHGGFLDRFDGLLLAAPFIAAFLVLAD